MEMLVSGYVERNGEKICYVMFSDGAGRSAEGTLPGCLIETNKGFTKDEIAQLEEYLRNNRNILEEEARNVNPIRSWLRDK